MTRCCVLMLYCYMPTSLTASWLDSKPLNPLSNAAMKRLYQYFFRGLMAILPMALTVYLLYLFVSWIESVAMHVVQPLMGDFYLPGQGILLGILAILGLGFLISQPFTAKLFSWIELPMTNLPVVKSIYNSLKNFADYFSPQKSNSQQVVALRMPGHALAIVGLITRPNTHGLPAGLDIPDQVAVYLPMGYMIGGYTVFVPRSWVTPLDMSVEEAMRSSLLAWMASTRNTAEQNDAPPSP